MTSTIRALAYIVASLLFILSLRGLSHPDTARRGNVYGVAGMLIAVAATLLAAAAILIATINIAGGFLVTQRMLSMFRR